MVEYIVHKYLVYKYIVYIVSSGTHFLYHFRSYCDLLDGRHATNSLCFIQFCSRINWKQQTKTDSQDLKIVIGS